LETSNGNIRSSEKPSTSKAEEGYRKEATERGPLTHSQSHEAQNTVEHAEVRQKLDWTKEKIREILLVLHVLQKAFYRNLQENV
jgi:hypothetical protein